MIDLYANIFMDNENLIIVQITVYTRCEFHIFLPLNGDNKLVSCAYQIEFIKDVRSKILSFNQLWYIEILQMKVVCGLLYLHAGLISFDLNGTVSTIYLLELPKPLHHNEWLFFSTYSHKYYERGSYLTLIQCTFVLFLDISRYMLESIPLTVVNIHDILPKIAIFSYFRIHI